MGTNKTLKRYIKPDCLNLKCGELTKHFETFKKNTLEDFHFGKPNLKLFAIYQHVSDGVPTLIGHSYKDGIRIKFPSHL